MANDPEIPTWVLIQMTTFTNWLNNEVNNLIKIVANFEWGSISFDFKQSMLQLSSTNLQIENLSEDLRTGVTLIRIVEQLQKRVCTGKVYTNNPTEIQCLMNVQLALEALQEDNLKLVNIGR